MAKLQNMAMWKDLAGDSRISTTKSLFGLCSKTVYSPTGSRITGSKREYSFETGEKIERAMKASADKKAGLLAAIGKMEPTTLGNYLLEECHSDDNGFAALMLHQYSQMSYQPVTEICIFEGDDAKTVAGCL